MTQTPYAGKHLGAEGNEEPAFFKEIYCTESIYSVYKDKLQSCPCNQFEYIFTLCYKWN